MYQFHKATLHALAEITAAAGLEHPSKFLPAHLSRRVSPQEVRSFAELYPRLAPGELLRGTEEPRFRAAWAMADAEIFLPGAIVTA